jgi:hypothetical protein
MLPAARDAHLAGAAGWTRREATGRAGPEAVREEHSRSRQWARRRRMRRQSRGGRRGRRVSRKVERISGGWRAPARRRGPLPRTKTQATLAHLRTVPCAVPVTCGAAAAPPRSGAARGTFKTKNLALRKYCFSGGRRRRSSGPGSGARGRPSCCRARRRAQPGGCTPRCRWKR